MFLAYALKAHFGTDRSHLLLWKRAVLVLFMIQHLGKIAIPAREHRRRSISTRISLALHTVVNTFQSGQFTKETVGPGNAINGCAPSCRVPDGGN